MRIRDILQWGIYKEKFLTSRKERRRLDSKARKTGRRHFKPRNWKRKLRKDQKERRKQSWKRT